MERWQDWVMDGMLILTIATVIGAGVAIVYFLVDYVMRGMDEKGEGENK